MRILMEASGVANQFKLQLRETGSVPKLGDTFVVESVERAEFLSNHSKYGCIAMPVGELVRVPYGKGAWAEEVIRKAMEGPVEEKRAEDDITFDLDSITFEEEGNGSSDGVETKEAPKKEKKSKSGNKKSAKVTTKQ